jgi:HD-GYP domain-containing protein (c-di-GMP phosphodiesterase class II)
VATFAYVAGVWVLACGLTFAAWRLDGPPSRSGPLLVLAVLALASWRFSISNIESRVQFSVGHIVVLSAVAMLAPAGAGIVGLCLTLLSKGPLLVRSRVFNAGMWTAVATAGGLAYRAVGGHSDVTDLPGLGPLLLHVGLPLVVVDVFQTVLNVVLLAGVMRIAEGIPVRVLLARLLSSTGVTSFGYGLLAFLLIVLWQSAGLGPFSVVLILAPLLGAWWAYRQFADERIARERTLEVLVAAIETKAPHLEGHSARVAQLTYVMAEDLGLGPGEVRDIRIAGMLHDLGQVGLPTAVVQGRRADDPVFRSYARRGAHMLREVSFLAGALDGIAYHNDLEARPLGTAAAGRTGADGMSPHLVHIADAFDLLTAVGDDDGRTLSADQAVDRLRAELPERDAELVDVLVRVLAHRPEAGAS